MKCPFDNDSRNVISHDCDKKMILTSQIGRLEGENIYQAEWVSLTRRGKHAPIIECYETNDEALAKDFYDKLKDDRFKAEEEKCREA